MARPPPRRRRAARRRGRGADVGELAGAVVEWRGADGVRDRAGVLSEDGALALPDAAGRTVCLRLPAPWRATERADACAVVPDRPDADVRVAVARQARVGVVFEGLADDRVAGSRAVVRVTLLDPADAASTERGRLDGSGHYQPRRALAGQTACVTTPPGWEVRSPETDERDGARCTRTPVADPHGDLVFTLVATDGGG
ncbi:hypothetical protein ACFQV2_13505 [Actinokineospora soli]|uniref:Uncharacterized protein n=1 Tax=Actinokineospora soli TaxID=1048753 RepID=A0ABW2TKW1_9PSEU